MSLRTLLAAAWPRPWDALAHEEAKRRLRILAARQRMGLLTPRWGESCEEAAKRQWHDRRARMRSSRPLPPS